MPTRTGAILPRPGRQRKASGSGRKARRSPTASARRRLWQVPRPPTFDDRVVAWLGVKPRAWPPSGGLPEGGDESQSMARSTGGAGRAEQGGPALPPRTQPARSALTPGSPAARAGVQAFRRSESGGVVHGDVITAINDEPVANLDDLLTQLERYNPNDNVTLTLSRDGKTRKQQVTLGASQS